MIGEIVYSYSFSVNSNCYKNKVNVTITVNTDVNVNFNVTKITKFTDRKVYSTIVEKVLQFLCKL